MQNMENGMVEVVEYYKGTLTRRTVNGVDLPLTQTELEQEYPFFFSQNKVLSKEEFKNLYGKIN